MSGIKRLSQLRFELDSSSICARFELDSIRFENPVTIAIRFDMRSIRASIRAFEKRMNMFNFFHYRIESSSNRARIESSVTIAIRARFDSRILSQLRFDSICARFELDSIRELCHNCDSIRYALDSSIREFPILESSRNCDRVLESNRARIERISSSNRARIVIVTDA